MAVRIFTAVCGAYQENTYLVYSEESDSAVLIDPGDDEKALNDLIARGGKRIAAMLLTHGHFDHTVGAQLVDAPLYIHAEDAEMLSDAEKSAYNQSDSSLPMLKDAAFQTYGDTLEIAGLRFTVRHTPGHSKGSVCLYLPDEALMFTGDTLFHAGFGRMDLYGGSMHTMYATLTSLLRELPPETCIYPGHGTVSSIGAEKERYKL